MSDDFGLWDLMVSIFWFMLLVAWILLLFRILADVFSDSELGGAAKAGWTLLILIVPWLGVLIYLIARGNSMNARAIKRAQAAEARTRAFIQETAGTTTVATDLRDLAALRDAGTITPEDYEQAKAKILA